MTPEQNWGASARMVLTEIKRHGEQLDRHEVLLGEIQRDITERLSAIQIAIVTGQTGTASRISTVEENLKNACNKIGKADTCRDHTKSLSQLEERVEQHNSHHLERFKAVPDIWTEINKLREWVKNVNDAGLIDQTEGRVRWGMTIITGAGGGTVVVVMVKLIEWVLGR